MTLNINKKSLQEQCLCNFFFQVWGEGGGGGKGWLKEVILWISETIDLFHNGKY